MKQETNETKNSHWITRIIDWILLATLIVLAIMVLKDHLTCTQINKELLEEARGTIQIFLENNTNQTFDLIGKMQ